jgi:hypothetical protein
MESQELTPPAALSLTPGWCGNGLLNTYCRCCCALQIFTRPFVDGDSVLVQGIGNLAVSGVVEKTTGGAEALSGSVLKRRVSTPPACCVHGR